MFYTQPLSALGALAAAGLLYKYIETQPGASTHTAHGESELPIFEREPESPSNTDKGSDSETETMCVSPAHRQGPSDWRSGSRFKTARTAMLALEEGDLQFKYWRPFVLFLCAIDGDANYVRQRGMLDALAQLVRSHVGNAGHAREGGVRGGAVDEVIGDACTFRLALFVRVRCSAGYVHSRNIPGSNDQRKNEKRNTKSFIHKHKQQTQTQS